MGRKSSWPEPIMNEDVFTARKLLTKSLKAGGISPRVAQSWVKLAQKSRTVEMRAFLENVLKNMGGAYGHPNHFTEPKARQTIMDHLGWKRIPRSSPTFGIQK